MIALYDTTLRDGAQCEDVNLSCADKLKIALKLDELGIPYIEGGWPGANTVDTEFFEEIRSYHLKNTKISAFGSTHHASSSASSDPTLAALIACHATVLTIFGKTSEVHAKEALRLDGNRNLEIIRDSVAFLKSHPHVETVFFDAEHFFDGYKNNSAYALSALKAAHEAGASALVLCDTNGGSLPHEITEIVSAVKAAFPDATLGIHAHNDCEMAVANTLAAVRAGVRHVQGTINGVGERCGNANLCSIIPILELKEHMLCLPEGKLPQLTATSSYVAEIANMTPFNRQPFVGHSAFAHKGGVHVSAVNKNSSLYEHITPELVGNGQRILMTDLAGRSNIVSLAKRFGFHLDKDEPVVKGLFNEMKKRSSLGYDYATAEASIELLLLRKLARRGVREFFKLLQLRVVEYKMLADTAPLAEATIMVEVEGAVEHTAATGMGPVNALDNALRKALLPFYPRVADMRLMDFKVRVLSAHVEKSAHKENIPLTMGALGADTAIAAANAEASKGTASVVRVLIESADNETSWITVGVSYDIIEASWQALADSVTYKLYKDEWKEHSNV